MGSPFFRGFRGWRQIRENNKTAILGVVAYTIYSVSQHRVHTYYIEVYKLAVTSIFNVLLPAQKDHNSNEIFVMGVAYCAASMTKISLLLWSFCENGGTLKIDVTASFILLCSKCLLGAETHCIDQVY